MSILLRNNRLIILLATMLVIFGLGFPYTNTSAYATSKSDLAKQISSQFVSSKTEGTGNVLSAKISIPFYPRGFVYPISQLGNCDSKRSCYEFCEQAENLQLCAMTSFRNGYMSADQLKQTLAFSNYLDSGYIAACDDYSGCVGLCNDEANRQQCNMLADGMRQGARVLGAQDVSSPVFESIFTKGIQNNNYQESGSVLSALDNLISEGQAPAGCVTAQQCQSYCSVSSNAGCDALFSKLSYATGMMSGFSLPGRVLNVSSDDPPAPVIEETPVETPPRYEPQGYLSCVMDDQSRAAPTEQGVRDADVFMDSASRCDQEHGAAASKLQQFVETGSQVAADSIFNVSQCMLSKESSADIYSCLNTSF